MADRTSRANFEGNAEPLIGALDKIQRKGAAMASALEQDGKRAGKAVDGIGDGAGGAAAKLDRETRSMAQSIQRYTAVVEAGGKKNADSFEALAKIRGLPIDAIKGDLEKLRTAEAAAAKQAEASLARLGVSAGQTANALRQVPAQFTDIVTSLQGGQNPLSVLLQQGGQLKDSFGGSAAAARAMAGYVAGLVSPMTLLVGGAVALAAGLQLGASEGKAFAQSLILSGNAAGATGAQLAAMAAAIGKSGAATTGRAAELLASMAASGGLAADGMQRAAQAALLLEKSGGPAAEKTAEAFAALGKTPLESALKLNEAQNFLTRSTYEQIKVLTEQGRTTDAAKVAQDAFAAALEDRAPKMLKTLGLVERAWLGVKGAVLGAVDAIKGVGREEGIADQVKQIEDLIEKNKSASGVIGKEAAARELLALNQKLALVQRGLGYEALSAAYEAQRTKEIEAQVRFSKDDGAFKSRAERLKQAIDQVRNEGLAAGSAVNAELNAQVERRIALLKERADPGVNLQRVKDAEAQKLEALKQSQAQIELLRSVGALNEVAAIEAGVAATLKGFEIRRAAASEELAIVSKRQDSEREAQALRGKIGQIDQEKETAQLAARNLLAVAIYKQQQAVDALVRSQQEETRQEQADYFVRESNARQAASLAVTGYTKAIDDAGKALAFETQLLGLSQAEREKRLAQYRIEIALREKLAEIDKVFGQDPAAESERQRVRQAAAREAAQIEGKAYVAEWQKTLDTISDGLFDALTKGGEAASKKLKDVFEKLVLRPAIEAVVGNVLGSANGALGGGLNAWQFVGAAVDYGAAYGGSRYGTSFGSEQSRALAAQDAGLTDAAGAAASLTAAGPYIAAIVAGSKLALGDQKNGFNESAARRAGDGFGGNFGVGAVFGEASSFLKRLGVNDAWADILSQSTGFAKVFGRADPRGVASGFAGSFGGGGFDGQAFTDWVAKGGLLRSSKSGTAYAGLSGAQDAQLDAQGKALLGAVTNWAETLKLPVERLKSVTTNVRVQLTGRADEDEKAIAAAAKTYTDALSETFKLSVAPFAKAGEDVSATLQRLSGLQTFANEINGLGGVFGRVAGLAFDARESLFEMAGGIDAFRRQAQGFVSNFYSRDEIAGVKARDVQGVLSSVGISQDVSTKEQFRALVEGAEVTTESGRQTLAALLGLQGDFSAVAEYLSSSNLTLSQAAAQAPDSAVLQGLIDANNSTEQIGAIQLVGDHVVSVREAIIELIQVVKDGVGLGGQPVLELSGGA